MYLIFKSSQNYIYKYSTFTVKKFALEIMSESVSEKNGMKEWLMFLIEIHLSVAFGDNGLFEEKEYLFSYKLKECQGKQNIVVPLR